MNTNQVRLDRNSALMGFSVAPNGTPQITGDEDFEQALRDVSRIEAPADTPPDKKSEPAAGVKASEEARQGDAAENTDPAGAGDSQADKAGETPTGSRAEEKKKDVSAEIPLTFDPGLIVKPKSAVAETESGLPEAPASPESGEASASAGSGEASASAGSGEASASAGSGEVSASKAGDAAAFMHEPIDKAVLEADSTVSTLISRETKNAAETPEPEKATPAFPVNRAASSESRRDKGNPVTLPVNTELPDSGNLEKTISSQAASMANQPSSSFVARDGLKKESEGTREAPVNPSEAVHAGPKGPGKVQVVQKEAGNSPDNDTRLLNNPKPVMETDGDPQNETVAFQSLITRRDPGAAAKERHAPDSLNTANGARGGGPFHASSIRDGVAVRADIKLRHETRPREVFDRSVVDQVVTKATLLSRNGKNEMHIQLDPPSLGSVKIQVSVRGENVNAKLVADNHVARDILDRNLPQLKNSFTDHGLKVNQMSVSVGNDSQQQAANYFRPFYMERGYEREQAGGPAGKGPAKEHLPSGIQAVRTESGGISVFA